MKKYYSPDMINSEAQIVSINDHELKIVKINGKIYRGDTHDAPIIRKTPAFYSDMESAVVYILQETKDKFLKGYLTKKPINLLVISKSNHKMLDIFFREVLMKDKLSNKIVVKMTHILLQVCFGMIDGDMDSLDLWGFSTEEIINYLKYHKYTKSPKITIDNFIRMITTLNKKGIRPSRMSIRPLDKILMHNLKDLFSGYDIQGMWFYSDDDPEYFTLGSSVPFKNLDNQFCNRVEKDIYEDDGITCVTTELCIFDPSKYLTHIMNVQIDKK
jgi:hypothetical protein